jgi:hypothetical protein
MYGNQLLRDYETVERAEPGWQGLLDKYEVDVLLIADRLPITGALAADGGWKRVFGEDGRGVYERRQPRE